MPVHEIRESLSAVAYTTAATQMLLSKTVNLSPGVSHTMIHTDFFIDNPVNSESTWQNCVVLVTPQPMILTDESATGQDFSMMSAANNNVLYKAYITRDEEGRQTIMQEFPNNFLGSQPTFEFYNNKLYLYALIDSGRDALEIYDFRVTFYTALKSKRVSTVTLMMGRQQEFFRSQVARINTVGRFIGPANYLGQTYPLYAYGGIRPERMLSGSNFANFFLKAIADRDEELMSTPAGLRNIISGARTMVSNLNPFGEVLGASPGAIPDWVRFGVNEGLQSGPIRPQWPPLKHTDSGNTRML